MRREPKPMSWVVVNLDYNAQEITEYDVLKHREGFIKRLKKKFITKEEFAEALRLEMMCLFWSRSEHELVIEIDDNGRIWLNPWVGCREPENVRIDVTDKTDFDWRGFAEHHISRQIYKNKAKIDVYSQLEYRWDEFVDYVWNYRHKYQRKKNV